MITRWTLMTSFYTILQSIDHDMCSAVNSLNHQKLFKLKRGQRFKVLSANVCSTNSNKFHPLNRSTGDTICTPWLRSFTSPTKRHHWQHCRAEHWPGLDDLALDLIGTPWCARQLAWESWHSARRTGTQCRVSTAWPVVGQRGVGESLLEVTLWVVREETMAPIDSWSTLVPGCRKETSTSRLNPCSCHYRYAQSLENCRVAFYLNLEVSWYRYFSQEALDEHSRLHDENSRLHSSTGCICSGRHTSYCCRSKHSISSDIVISYNDIRIARQPSIESDQ